MTTALSITGVLGWGLLSLPYIALLWAMVAMRFRSAKNEVQRKTTISASGNRGNAQPALALVSAEAAPPLRATPESAKLFEIIQDVENRGGREQLAGLYLKLGQSLRIEGAQTKAIEALVHCISLATETNDRTSHAHGRLELGEISADTGDIATACEHWMIARNVFDDLGDAELRDATGERMRRSNCPTEWVLTQF